MNKYSQSENALENRPSDTCWMEVLQRALDGLFPTEKKLEEFLDRWERMP